MPELNDTQPVYSRVHLISQGLTSELIDEMITKGHVVIDENPELIRYTEHPSKWPEDEREYWLSRQPLESL